MHGLRFLVFSFFEMSRPKAKKKLLPWNGQGKNRLKSSYLYISWKVKKQTQKPRHVLLCFIIVFYYYSSSSSSSSPPPMASSTSRWLQGQGHHDLRPLPSLFEMAKASNHHWRRGGAAMCHRRMAWRGQGRHRGREEGQPMGKVLGKSLLVSGR